MQRIIISAAGPPAWQFKDWPIPKHLLKIEGEWLLHRTVRQALTYSDDVWVVGPADPRYKVPGARLLVTDSVDDIGWIDCYLQVLPIRHQTERTVHLLGDVYYSDEAMETICADERREWMYYARFGAATLYECDHGEGWGIGFYPEHFVEHDNALRLVIDAYRSSTDKNYLLSLGWPHYRLMAGLDPCDHVKG